MRRVLLAGLAAGLLSSGWPGGRERAEAAPAPPSYAGVKKSIESIRATLDQPGAQQPNALGWLALFDSIQGDLDGYTKATDSASRLAALERLDQVSNALAAVPWSPAQELRGELASWAGPRIQLERAELRLDETIRNLPATDDAAVRANRQRWSDFVANDLGKALSQYNAATTVAQRLEGLKKVHEALRLLRTRNQEFPWQPSWDLQNAVSALFNQPNIDVTADVNTVSPLFNQWLVASGPVYRKGYWSQVTAGPKTGFGLLPSDDGIMFYNKQMLTSVTPITDFQNQIASDPQGQRAAKLYVFSATTVDQAELTIYTMLRTSGLQIWPAYNHNIDAQICSVPAQGGGLGRAVAGLVGMDQQKINQKVYEGAIGQFRQRIPGEAQEEAETRIAGETAQRNAQIRPFLPGNDTATVQDFLVSGLSLRSRPDAVYVGGLLQSRSGDRQRGADSPQPATLAVPSDGLTADVHVVSVLEGIVGGLFERPAVQAVENVMVRTNDVPPGTPPGEAAAVRVNVDFPTYLKVVDDVRSKNNAKITAIRVKRPSQPPDFAADARGYLVAIIHDVQIEVPAPDPKSQAGSVVGVRGKVLRMKIPQLEVAFSHQFDPATRQITAKIHDFMPSPNSQVLAIEEDESKGSPLTRFTGALVINAMAAKIRTQPMKVSLDNLNLRGFAIRSLSPLDPSGWMRVNLVQVGPMTPATPEVLPTAPAAPPAQSPTTSPPAAAAEPVPTAAAVPVAEHAETAELTVPAVEATVPR
ncbi:hypothetical protein [Aquisphaera insulae]|uniref:hypothetical protein n=1 Tax=Aquisphaera insulae TaxID=2712864 RepID=UPI0013EDCBA8|nr:hypothetical protein [Aquisphaera insulae]